MSSQRTSNKQLARANPVAVGRRTRAAWRRLSPFFRTSRLKIAVLALVAVLAGFAEASLLALVAAVAAALSQDDTRVDLELGPMSLEVELPVMFAVGVGLALLRGGLQLLMAYLPANMSASVMADLRRRLFDAFIRTSWPVKAAERDGHYQSLSTQHINAAAQAVITLGTGVSAVLIFLTLLASAFLLSLSTAIILTVASLALFLGLRPLARRLRGHARSLSAENLQYAEGVQEVVLMAEETEVFGASPAYRSAFYRLIDDVRQPLMRTRFLSTAVPALYQSVALLLLVLALIVVYLIGAGGIATLGAVVLMLVRALSYGQQIQTAVSAIDEKVPFMHRLGDAIDRYESNPQQDGDQPLPATIERLGMRDVHFAYRPGEKVLEGLSFTVNKGEAVGIAGPSGAGKSSLVQLLLRLRDPDRGAVEVNGQDARSFRRDDWQQRVAYVPQSSQVIWGTVTENIRFYRPHLSDAQIECAARRAQIHDEIMSWPKGYDTVIGQRASAVSGGQRQRLCLARALADDPEVLILDEPTSALDVKSEALVQETLEELRGEVILFLVGHRLSTLSFCDRIMVVVGGHLEAFAAPNELMATNGFYQEVSEITRKQATV